MAYRCLQCQYESPQWMGFCPQCGTAEPLAEGAAGAAIEPIPLAKVGDTDLVRVPVGISEVDRVLGGGLVPGGVILVGGEPGVGKSTLLLQAAAALAAAGGKVLLATAEESVEQIGLRAARLGLASDEVHIVASGDVDAILSAAASVRPDLIVIDSIQTVVSGAVSGGAGSVPQVRESVAQAIRFAKASGTATALVGHVTKDGTLAGPKLVEHAVDVVLYLEGDADSGLRTLRSFKNRFGATHVTGIFEMRSEGLTEVDDPSAAFLAGWRGSVPGSVVFPTLDGRRPLLVEVQALVVPTTSPQPRRSVRGLEAARVHQVLAVLERHARLSTAGQEVYIAVSGGLRVTEPGIDLAVALAAASSLRDQPLGMVAAWGEVGLTGEVRPVPHADHRRSESERLGLERIVAAGNGTSIHLSEALAAAGLG